MTITQKLWTYKNSQKLSKTTGFKLTKRRLRESLDYLIEMAMGKSTMMNSLDL